MPHMAAIKIGGSSGATYWDEHVLKAHQCRFVCVGIKQ